MIGRRGERGSGISVLAAGHDDDDNLSKQSKVTSYLPCVVIPKTFKIVLDSSFLNTHQYKVRIQGKMEQFRERSSALPYTSV